tara:strand:- start:147 stop:362 length:216 start_codon:yes stop_codon:yes gene_type:complete
MDNYPKFILTIIALSTSILAVLSFLTKKTTTTISTGEVQLMLSPYIQPTYSKLRKKISVHPFKKYIIKNDT